MADGRPAQSDTYITRRDDGVVVLRNRKAAP